MQIEIDGNNKRENIEGTVNENQEGPCITSIFEITIRTFRTLIMNVRP